MIDSFRLSADMDTHGALYGQRPLAIAINRMLGYDLGGMHYLYVSSFRGPLTLRFESDLV